MEDYVLTIRTGQSEAGVLIFGAKTNLTYIPTVTSVLGSPLIPWRSLSEEIRSISSL